MDRSLLRNLHYVCVLLVIGPLLGAALGCNLLLAGHYIWKGRNVPAEYPGLEQKRVVVVCRPPSSLQYRYSGVERELARRVSALLHENVTEVDVVKQSEVENWQDQRDIEDYQAMAHRVIEIDMHSFDLHNGPQLRQGQCDLTITVYDMEDDGKEDGQFFLSDLKYPATGGVPALEKSERTFRKQFVSLLSHRIARHFYEHEPYMDFASDVEAYR